MGFATGLAVTALAGVMVLLAARRALDAVFPPAATGAAPSRRRGSKRALAGRLLDAALGAALACIGALVLSDGRDLPGRALGGAALAVLLGLALLARGLLGLRWPLQRRRGSGAAPLAGGKPRTTDLPPPGEDGTPSPA